MKAAITPRAYLAYLFLLAGMLIAALITIDAVQRQQRIALNAQLDTLENATEGLAAYVATQIEDALALGGDANPVLLQQRVDSFKKIEDIFNVRVSRSDTKVMAAIRRKNLEKPESLPIMLKASGGETATAIEVVDKVRNFCVARPLIVNGANWGAVVVYRNLEPLYQRANLANRQIMLATAGAFVLTMVAIGILLSLAYREVRRAREAEAAQARLAMMGTMAASVAHEIRNPLNSLGLTIEYLRRKATRDTSTSEQTKSGIDGELNMVQHEILRLDKIVRDFSDLSRPPQVSLQKQTVDQMIFRVIKLMEPVAARRKIDLSSHLDAQNVPLQIDEDRMEQVLINLVKNAIEATPEGGKVEIRCVASSKGLAIEIADTGRGISLEQQKTLFQPFSSSKPNGLGLGLFLAKRLVEAQRGTLDLRSIPRQGTTVSVQLPLAA
jgi:signal transduction histidine kinase